jgi:hypothetical protein
MDKIDGERFLVQQDTGWRISWRSVFACIRLPSIPPTRRTRLLGRPFSPALDDAIVINESQHPHYSRETFLSSHKRRHGYEATHGFAMITILVGVFGGRAQLSTTGSGVMGEQGIHINGV